MEAEPIQSNSTECSHGTRCPFARMSQTLAGRVLLSAVIASGAAIYFVPERFFLVAVAAGVASGAALILYLVPKRR
jgi:hypothetical protein